MKRRIVLWAGAGFLIASCFVLFTFLASPESLQRILQRSGGKVFAFVCAPIIFAFGRQFPIAFWWVPPSTAATYAMLGLIAELLRHKPDSRVRLAS